MKLKPTILAACAAAVTLSAGCSKTEPPSAPTTAQQTQSAPEPQSPASTPTAPMPPPNVTKRDEGSGPKAGEAGDHSSPAFKGGGEKVSN